MMMNKLAAKPNHPRAHGWIYGHNPRRIVTVILDFQALPANGPEHADIRRFFAECRRRGLDPRAPAQRQAFHVSLLRTEKADFLLGRYGEDRTEMLRGSKIAQEGRVLHLGIDLFAAEPVDLYTPAASIVREAGCEEGDAAYGPFLLLEHPEAESPTRWSFWGHLSRDLPTCGSYFRAGEKIARMGALGENGGWSVHLHLQWLRNRPSPGTTPPGYTRPEDWRVDSAAYPDPIQWVTDCS